MPEYDTWSRLKQRCLNTKCSDYKDYGGRGISICERWLNSFDCFLSDMGLRPSKTHSIERKNVNGNYEPSNCIWATPEQQQNNRRNNRIIEFNGKRQSMMLWSLEIGINYRTLQDRLVNGWSIEKSLCTPVRRW
jgi:hypothetical protein